MKIPTKDADFSHTEINDVDFCSYYHLVREAVKENAVDEKALNGEVDLAIKEAQRILESQVPRLHSGVCVLALFILLHQYYMQFEERNGKQRMDQMIASIAITNAVHDLTEMRKAADFLDQDFVK